MVKPPNDDQWKGLREVSASGLDTRQIAPEDIASLNALFQPQEIALSLQPRLGIMEISKQQPRLDNPLTSVALGVPEPRPLRIKIEPLPKMPRRKRLKIKAPGLRCKKNLAASFQQPIRRRRLRLSMLTPGEQKNLTLALKKKFGPAAKDMFLVAAFANIPPESADTIRVDNNLRYATFVPKVNSRNQAGFFLLILETKDNKTEKVLVRL